MRTRVGKVHLCSKCKLVLPNLKSGYCASCMSEYNRARPKSAVRTLQRRMRSRLDSRYGTSRPNDEWFLGARSLDVAKHLIWRYGGDVENMQIDHIVPFAAGADAQYTCNWANLQLLSTLDHRTKSRLWLAAAPLALLLGVAERARNASLGLQVAPGSPTS